MACLLSISVMVVSMFLEVGLTSALLAPTVTCGSRMGGQRAINERSDRLTLD